MPNLSQVGSQEALRRDYNVSKFPKSGFNLTYNSHVGGLVMGRLYPAGYAHILPNTRDSQRNEYNLYAEQLVTPVVSDVNVAVRNFFVTYRAVDKGFEDLLTPTELNGMSASLSAPSFALRTIVENLFTTFVGNLLDGLLFATADAAYKSKFGADFCWYIDPSQFDSSAVSALLGGYMSLAAYHYMDDVYDDLYKSLMAYLDANASVSLVTSEDHLNFIVGFIRIFFDFFIGEGSLLDYLGYPIMNHKNSRDYLIHFAYYNTAAYVADGGDISSPVKFADMLSALGNMEFVDFGNYEVDACLVNEYAIRAYYAIWFEYFRHKHLEPRSANLWEYRTFGSIPLFSGSTLTKAIACLLPLRCDNWADDPFNSADVDDICRHVFAPIIGTSGTSNFVSYAGPSMPSQADPSVSGSNQPRSTNTGNLLSNVSINYVNNVGSVSTISCPVPVALSSMDVDYSPSFASVQQSYNLDLFTLKKAQMLERYLKRNFAFGDEYRDRMRAHYDVTIDDYRINRPVWLSGSFKAVNIDQAVASTGAVPNSNMSDQMVVQGSRLAYGKADSDKVSDGIEYFASEFGIRISLLSIVPRAQFDITCPQNFIIKTADFFTPEFAQQQEDIMNSREIYRLGLYNRTKDNKPFGHVPYAHAYRYRADDVHGQMLSSKFDYTFCRFYQGLTDDGVPKLNYKFLHCRPNIPMFLNSILLDGQFYGTIKHNILCEQLLPQPVEQI